MKILKFAKYFLVVVITSVIFAPSIYAEPESSSIGGDYQTNIEQLDEVIGRQKDYIEKRKEQLETYTSLGENIKRQISTDLSDYSTKITLIENDLDMITGETAKDSLPSIRTRLLELQSKLIVLNSNHQDLVLNSVKEKYLKIHKDKFVKINDFLKANSQRIPDYKSLEAQLDDISDQLDSLSNTSSEEDWGKYEDTMKAFIKQLRTVRKNLTIKN